MLTKDPTRASADSSKKNNEQQDEFEVLLQYMLHLAKFKMGYPVSLLTHIGIINNKALGITPGTLANLLLNNVGDPFIDSQTSRMEVKRHERKLIRILEKYYGLSRNQARGYVTTGGTEGNFASLWWSKRYLINLVIDQLVDTDAKVKQQMKKEQDLVAALAKISFNAYKERAESLQKVLDIKSTIADLQNKVQQLLTPTVFFAEKATHYSIPKISEILRLNIRTIQANADGSINLTNLKKELILHNGAHPHSAIIIIANIGTTITGAIDDVPGIKKVLDQLKLKIPYTIHMDGALTGFVMPILKPFGDIPNYFDALGVNTLVFSAHKYPGLSQPCGIVLANKSFFEKAFEKSERSIDYVGNIRDVTITGSRSGLNVLMFYNALHTLGLADNTDKLKKMLDGNLETAKYLYKKLIDIYGPDKVSYPSHFNVIFPKPSMRLAKKYQLMLSENTATICVLSNISKDLIDTFLEDLQHDKETSHEDTSGTSDKN